MPIPLQQAAHNLEEGRKDPTSKQFDDDEWVRSLTEAQEISADVPEDSVINDQQAVDPKKVWPFEWANSAEIRPAAGSLRQVKEKMKPS